MPVLNVDRQRLGDAIGRPVDDATLSEQLAMLGCVPEDTEGDEWAIEVFPDRPDLLTAEHLGRALRAYLGDEPGLVGYDVGSPTEELVVEESVQDIRGVIVGGRASGLELDEASLTGLMDLQEDLHWGLGARRRKVSVGIHDASGIEPPYTYRAVDPDEVSFVPLRGAEEMTMRRMIKEIEKGVEYAHLVEGHDRWPLIVDADGEVLSFPPIINGTRTTVTTRTTDVFVDVTGVDERSCREVLNVVMTQLAELGAALEAVTVRRPDADVVTPDLSPTEHTLALERVESLLGIAVTPDQVAGALERMGHDARTEGDELAVDVGAWRTDVLHPVDLVEDVAIGLGYDRFEGTEPRSVTFGEPSEAERFDAQVRRTLTGLGYLECMTLTLTSEEEQTTLVDADDQLTAVDNPVSSEQAVLRRRLLPGLLTLAADNTHRDLPQCLFEIGDVIDPGGEGGRPINRRRVAGLVVAPEASFTGIKSHVEALFRALDRPTEVEAGQAPALLEGRTAVALDRGTGERIGVYGEVDPATLERYDLVTPCAGFELTLSEIPTRATWSPRET